MGIHRISNGFNGDLMEMSGIFGKHLKDTPCGWEILFWMINGIHGLYIYDQENSCILTNHKVVRAPVRELSWFITT